MVERVPDKNEAVGSIPTTRTECTFARTLACVYKNKVLGSIPSRRTFFMEILKDYIKNPKILVGIAVLLILVPFLVGVLELKDRVFPREATLQARIYSHMFILPPLEGNEKVNIWGRPEPSISNLYGVRSLWAFVVENNGKTKAANTEIEIPRLVGFYSIGEEQSPIKFEEIVSLGDLQPGKVVYFYVWSTNLPQNGLGEADIRLSFDGGVANLKFYREVAGLGLVIAENLFVSIILLVSILLVGMMVFSGILYRKKIGLTLGDVVALFIALEIIPPEKEAIARSALKEVPNSNQ